MSSYLKGYKAGRNAETGTSAYATMDKRHREHRSPRATQEYLKGFRDGQLDSIR